MNAKKLTIINITFFNSLIDRFPSVVNLVAVQREGIGVLGFPMLIPAVIVVSE